jgi:hypothetical protein
MMRHVMWLLLFSTLCPLLQAQTVLATESVKKAVVFLYATDSSNDKNSLGTGFLIKVPVKGAPSSVVKNVMTVEGSVLLVTARHIVDPAWGYCSRKQSDTIYMRVNKKDYDPTKDTTGVDYLSVLLVKNGVKQYFVRDDDDEVDAAFVDISAEFPQDKYDAVPMVSYLFASSDEMKKLQIGDSIASAGLIPGKSGEKRNYPFFKFGEISNIPDEPIWMACDPGMPELRLERVWFIATNLVGGNSGSPIFFVPLPMCLPGGGATCTRGLSRPAIIGVQSSSVGGADIAGMTPIEDVFKIIEQHSLPNLDLYRGEETQRK